LQPPCYCYLDTGPFPPRSRSLNTGPSPSTGSYCIKLLLPRSGSPSTWPSQLTAALLLQPGHRALAALLQLSGHWDWAFTAAPLPPPGSWHWDLTATRPSAPQRLLLSSAPPYHRTSSNPEGEVQRLSTMRSDHRRRLHVALGPGPPRCAGPAALHHSHRQSPSPHPTAGGVPLLSTMLFDSHYLHVALGPGPPRCAGPAAPRRLHCPPVLPHSPRSFAVEHRQHPGGVQLLSTMCSDH
jgi:hypothetical protein